MKKFFGRCIIVLVLLALVLPGFVSATHGGPHNPPSRFFGGVIPQPVSTGDEFLDLVVNLTNWLFILIILFSVVMLVLAGWQFISGGGDPQAVAQARNKLLWAVLGIILALLARSIPLAIENIITG